MAVLLRVENKMEAVRKRLTLYVCNNLCYGQTSVFKICTGFSNCDDGNMFVKASMSRLVNAYTGFTLRHIMNLNILCSNNLTIEITPRFVHMCKLTVRNFSVEIYRL